MSALVLPGQISGDIVKLMAVSHRQSDKSTFVLSLIVDRMSLFLAIATLALLGTLGLGQLSKFVELYVGAIIIVAFLLPSLILVCRYRSAALPAQIRSMSDKCPRFCRYLMRYVANSLSLPRLSVDAVIMIVVLALCLQVVSAAGAYFVAISVNIDISLIDWLVINSIIALVQALPLTVGGLGTREGVFGIILGLYEIPISQAVTVSLIGFSLFASLTVLCWMVLRLVFDGKAQQ
jgi:uncharacterized membrane protein YbhN (UPF0104 family)